MKKLPLLLLCSFIVFGLSSFGQGDGGVSIGKGDKPANAKSILEMVSQTKGVLVPRMTTEQRTAIFTAADLTAVGLLVFDSTTNSFFYWNGTIWKDLATTTTDNLISEVTFVDGKTLSIKEGTRALTVDLSSLSNVVKRFDGVPVTAGIDNQLGFDALNSTFYIYKTDKWILLNGDKDKQNLSLTGTQLLIDNGNTIDLLPVLGNTPVSLTAPAAPSAGNTYFNTTDKHLYVYNGTIWIAVDLDTDDQTLSEILGVNASAGNLKITNLAEPVDPNDATTKNYVDLTVSAGTADASTTVKGKIKLAGDLAGTAELPTVPGLLTKEPLIVAGTNAHYFRGDKTFQPLDKTAVGLANVENTADLSKPVSTATQTALDLKENLANKSTLATLGTSDELYPSQKAVKTYVDLAMASGTPDATLTISGKIKLAGDLAGTADLPVVAAGKITTAKIADAAVTYAKIQNTGSSNVVLGRTTAGVGVVEEIPTVGTGNVVRADSPILSGTPSLPAGTVAVTAAAGDNSTKIATTAFVSASGTKKWTNVTTVAYTLLADDYYLVNAAPAAAPGPVVITLPAPVLGIQGREFCVLNNNGTQTVSFSIVPVGSVTTVAPGSSAKFVCTGTYWFCITGN
jgi:hypothetical protein